MKQKALVGLLTTFLILSLKIVSAQNCGIPSDFRSSNLTSTTVSASWTRVSVANKYVVRLRPVGSNSWRRLSTVSPAKTITGLIPNTEYEIMVRSACYSEESGYTQPLYFTTPSTTATSCGTPANVRIQNLTSTSGLIKWNPVTGANEYTVRYRVVGATGWTRRISGNNSETITGLTPNTQYEVLVKTSCASMASNFSSTFVFSTPPVVNCQEPDVYYFTSNNITSNSCKVGWREVSDANSYNVRYRVRYSGAAWTQAGNTAHPPLTITGLVPATLYEFQVKTMCTDGNAAYSPSGIFTTANSSCDVPRNLAASSITDSSAIVSWSSLSCAAYYKVSYKKQGESWIYDTTSATSLTLTGLEQGATYEYRVKSIDDYGSNSAYSSISDFSTPSTSCGIPAGVSSHNITTSKATVDWDAVTGASYYRIRYRLAGASSWQTDTTSNTSITITGLSPDNVYQFQAKAECSNSSGSYSNTTSFITLPSPTNNIPVPDHIVICILENKAFTQLYNSNLTPRINALANDPKTAVFTESYGITHPSQPNYIHLFSGSSNGVSNNNTPSGHFNTPNLARELLNAGRTFKSYCEGLPSVGYDGTSSGRYMRKHNPVANWMGSGSNQVSATLNQPFTSFPTSNFSSLPTVSFVVPDMINSMHDGTVGTAIATGDSWVYDKMNAYIQWAKENNSLFILTTDEDDGNHNNRILTLITGEMVVGGSYSQPINHHTVLRTIAEMYGLNFIGGANSETSIHGCWTNGFRVRNPETPIVSVNPENSNWSIYPNPSHGEVHVSYELKEDMNVEVRIYANTGAIVHEKKLGPVSQGRHIYDVPLEEKRLPAGIYFMEVTYGSDKFIERFLISE